MNLLTLFRRKHKPSPVKLYPVKKFEMVKFRAQVQYSPKGTNNGVIDHTLKEMLANQLFKVGAITYTDSDTVNPAIKDRTAEIWIGKKLL